VWFQKISIPPSTTEGIGISEGVGGQRPRKFQRGGGLDSQFGFQMPFNSIYGFKYQSSCSKILSYLLPGK